MPQSAAPDGLFLDLQTALAGEYSLERELGRGGMGVVYLAREVRLAREVAIKVLPPQLAESPALREQFLREAQTAARLSHPHIVPIHRVDETGGFVYFVMTYVPGETLAERIRSRGPLAPHHAARVLREVSWALTYAHSVGIVHRDIKADNILLEQGTDRALVTDFGIANLVDTGGAAFDGRIAGSAHYVSPEQISGEPVGASSDLYSLGVVGFLALAGRLPFDAPTASEVVTLHLTQRAPSIATLAPTVPLKLAHVVERCLAKRPAQRFASAAAFAEALEQTVTPPREIPAPIRLWLEKTNHYGSTRLLAGVYGGVTLGGALAAATQSGWMFPPVAVATIAAVSILPITLRTHRVVAAGYGIDDLRAGIREYWMRRREEVAFELSSGSGRLTLRTMQIIFGASALGTVALTALVGKAFFFAAGLGIAAAAFATLTVATGVAAIGERLRRGRIHKLGATQMKFFDGKWGERFVRFAGAGAKTTNPATALPQLTEVALGRATDALYDALPKPMRKQLATLPPAVRRLEADAKSLRAELEKLDASIGSLDSDARDTMPSAIAESVHEGRIRGERDRLRSDLRTTRSRAADRLAATVAALENIRLDLMRLQLGDGQVASVTASLEAAQRIGDDLGSYVRGRHARSRIDAARAAEMTLIRPPAIVKGDTIGIVSPSYAPKLAWLQRGANALERAGFNVLLDPEVDRPHTFTRAEDQRRAANLMSMWLEPHVKAVIASTGGYGAVRLLPHLDPDVFREHPKSFVGYSDITALHLWLMRRANLRCFHGPTVDDLTPSVRDPTLSSLITALTTPCPTKPIGRELSRGVVSGKATGHLVGGNLSLIQQTIGTDYQIDMEGAILFVEETRDPMSVVDERLVHLRATGMLERVAGIVFGQLSLDRSEEDEFENFVLDLVADLHVPVLMDFPAGHENPNLTIPFGTQVELVVEDQRGWIVYREDALIAAPSSPSAPEG